MRVRHAKATDAAAIGAVHVSSWEGAYRGMIPDAWLDRRTVEGQTAIWEGLLGRLDGPADGPRLVVLVVELGDTVVGFGSANVPSRDPDADERTVEISAFYVEPGRWRQGAGAALMDVLLAEASARAGAAATLWVLEPNARARAFYERCGFADDGARRTEGDGWPMELRMRRAL